MPENKTKTLRISTANLILTQKDEDTDPVVEEETESDGEQKSDETKS